MSHFVSSATVCLTLEDGETVDVRKSISFQDFKSIFNRSDDPSDPKNFALYMPLLKAAIVSWSFKDENGANVPVSPESIEMLDVQTIMAVTKDVISLYQPEKKSS